MKKNFFGIVWIGMAWVILLTSCQSKKKEAAPSSVMKNPHSFSMAQANPPSEKKEAKIVRENLDGFLSFGDSLAIYPVWKEHGAKADTLKAIIKRLKTQGAELRELAKGKDDHALVVTFSAYHKTIRDFMREIRK
ncbi:MAG: hypothetical protein GXO76_03895 [Calditrichaeota bacterium]|nr:hypothetical protein [Calditrichota bacterium]